MNLLDKVIGYFAPTSALKRAHARNVLTRIQRSYNGAETTRLSGKRNRNQSADQELMGPHGGDALRAGGRESVRNNAYAWNVVDTLVSTIIGDGITAQSTFETVAGEDIEDVNDIRDKKFEDWCKVCDINGRLHFLEMQALAQREMAEAGEVLVRKIKTPKNEYNGISRPVPLALEMIEADRLAVDHDTYIARSTSNRVVRGIEMDDKGKPIAYWIYPDHPNAVYTKLARTPERVVASEIIHLFRMERVGQSRGASWLHPSMAHLRDLSIYIDNELQSSAVAACFGVAVTTETPIGTLFAPDEGDTTDSVGNTFEHIEPGMVARLGVNESIECINPGRPNAASEPWISLLLRGVAAGTGTSYEAVSKDFSKTSYSSSRTSKLEDRPRTKRSQNYIVWHFCQDVWDAFCDQAAVAGIESFPTSSELLEDRSKYAPVEWQRPELEWVDVSAEQSSAESSLNSFTDTYQNVLGARGLSYRSVFYQRAKEDKLRKKLGLLTEAERTQEMMAAQTASNTSQEVTGDATSTRNVAAEALNGAQITSLVDVITQVGTGAIPNEAAKAILAASFPTIPIEVINAIIDPIVSGSISADGVPSSTESTADTAAIEMGTSEMMGLSTQQWNRNRKAIGKILDELAKGITSAAAAKVFLSSVGMSPANVDILIDDATDGNVDTILPSDNSGLGPVQPAVARSIATLVNRTSANDRQIAELVTRQEELAKADSRQVVINMPQGPAPIVRNEFTAPPSPNTTINVAAPNVKVEPTFNVAAPNVTIEQPTTPTRTTITRDANGDIVETVTSPAGAM